jgi:hypothetical protein
MSGPSITWMGRGSLRRASSVSATMYVEMPLRQAFLHAARAPGLAARSLLRVRLEARRALHQPLGRVRAPVEDDVLDQLAQRRVELLVDAELAGVDDAHRHAGADRVVKERRVHRLAHRVVAAERERQVGDAARDLRMRQVLADPAHGLDVVDAVGRVLLQPGGHGEDVRVEHDVLGRHPH